jgi:hypothetical protein
LNEPGAGLLAPDSQQMTLPARNVTINGLHRIIPIRPLIEARDSLSIARRENKMLATQSWTYW